MSEKSPPSMREFDYFGDEVQPVDPSSFDDGDEGPLSLDDQLQIFQRQQRRYARYLVLMVITFGVCAWFLAGYRYDIAYAFSDPRPPRDVGDVVDFTPDQLVHNGFVRLTGITEHRGMTQPRVRGLSFSRREYWYFRLVGSRGMFVETPGDGTRFGPLTRVSVEGRVVDPESAPEYRGLLDAYHRRYKAKERPAFRVLQVDHRPGTHRTGYLVAFAGLAGLLVSNLLMLRRLVRHRRLRPGG